MLHNLTKILSFATGGPWDTADESRIFRRGRSGFEEVCVRYGLIPETTQQGARRKVLQVVDELERLLEMDRGYARSQIHELLAQAPRTRSASSAISRIGRKRSRKEICRGRLISSRPVNSLRPYGAAGKKRLELATPAAKWRRRPPTIQAATLPAPLPNLYGRLQPACGPMPAGTVGLQADWERVGVRIEPALLVGFPDQIFVLGRLAAGLSWTVL